MSTHSIRYIFNQLDNKAIRLNDAWELRGKIMYTQASIISLIILFVCSLSIVIVLSFPIASMPVIWVSIIAPITMTTFSALVYQISSLHYLFLRDEIMRHVGFDEGDRRDILTDFDNDVSQLNNDINYLTKRVEDLSKENKTLKSMIKGGKKGTKQTKKEKAVETKVNEQTPAPGRFIDF